MLSFLNFGINNSIKNATDNQTSFNLTGETDVVEFLTSLGTKLKEGALSVADVQQIQEGKPEVVEDVELRAAASLTPDQSARNKELMQRAKEGDILASNDLIQENSGLVLRLLGFNKDIGNVEADNLLQAVTDMATPGMVDITFPGRKKSLVEEYKESDGEVSTFLGRLRQRKAEIYKAAGLDPNKFITEQIDAPEARQIAADKVDVDVAEDTKKARGPRKPTETTIFSDTALANLGVNKAETEQQISDATKKSFKGQVVTGFGQTRNVPVKVAEIYGKMFGVNPETIYDKKRNYSKKDAEGLTRIKQYLIDNATSDFARLPKLKDDFGKATFIPNNVMNALYTNGKLTGTLKDYLDLIREKPVKPIYRDRVGQTIRGLFNTSIRNRMLEDLITSKPERIRAGAKFSLTPKQTNILEDVSVARNINTVLDLLGLDSASVNDENRAEIQEAFLEAIKKYGLTPNDILAGAFTSSGCS